MCFNMLFTHKITPYNQHIQKSYNLCNSVANVIRPHFLEILFLRNNREALSVAFCYFIKISTYAKRCFHAKTIHLKILWLTI